MKKTLLILALGLSLATFAQQNPSKNTNRMDKMGSEEVQQKRLKKLTKELTLDDKQQEQVGPILTENGAKVADLMKQMQALKEQMQTEKESFDGKMKAVLTADQYQKWTSMKSEAKEKMMNKKGDK